MEVKHFTKANELIRPVSLMESQIIKFHQDRENQLSSINEYLLFSIAQFEKGWLQHEEKLKAYELN